MLICGMLPEFLLQKKLGNGIKAPVLNAQQVIQENISGDKLLFYLKDI